MCQWGLFYRRVTEEGRPILHMGGTISVAGLVGWSASISWSLFLVRQTVRSSSQCSHLCELHRAFPDLMDWPSSEESLNWGNIGKIVIFKNLFMNVVSEVTSLLFFCDLTPCLKVNKIVFPCPIPLKITIDMLTTKEDLSLSGVSLWDKELQATRNCWERLD